MNHYDNPNRRTSLKDLEFNMNMDKIDAFELDFDADLALNGVSNMAFFLSYIGLALRTLPMLYIM
jgi:hypothetical protein